MFEMVVQTVHSTYTERERLQSIGSGGKIQWHLLYSCAKRKRKKSVVVNVK